MGRSLGNNLYNLGLFEACKEGLAEMGVDLEEFREREPDTALGNGGALAGWRRATSGPQVESGQKIATCVSLFQVEVISSKIKEKASLAGAQTKQEARLT